MLKSPKKGREQSEREGDESPHPRLVEYPLSLEVRERRRRLIERVDKGEVLGGS